MDRIDALLSTSTYTYAFVVGHMPAYPKYRHIGKSIDHFTFARDRLVRIMANHGAHFIHGHDHYANMIQINTSLHMGCGTINGSYGSAVVIDTDTEELGVRFYEVHMPNITDSFSEAFQYQASNSTEWEHSLQEKINRGEGRFRPVHLWGSRRFPTARPRFIEMGLMEANLEYLMDWINYFL